MNSLSIILPLLNERGRANAQANLAAMPDWFFAVAAGMLLGSLLWTLWTEYRIRKNRRPGADYFRK